MHRFLFKSLAQYMPVTELSLLVGFVGLAALFVASAPQNFSAGALVTISEGATLEEIAVQLGHEHIIRFPFILKAVTVVVGGAERVQAGAYLFESPKNVVTVAWRITHGVFGLTPVRVRLPEGATRNEMAAILSTHIDDFDTDRFLEVTEGREGYLFPDTYFFLPTARADDIAQTLEKTFTERISSLQDVIAKSGHSLEDIITMASLVEREAYDPTDRRLISGVLWKRIAIDMPLQVDAPFVILFGKASHELTRDELATTSPYNTYAHRGLPPGPIGNPGLDAIRAVLEPIESDYLYYLSDTDGVTHYAVTFEEHKENRIQHLE